MLYDDDDANAKCKEGSFEVVRFDLGLRMLMLSFLVKLFTHLTVQQQQEQVNDGGRRG